MGGLNLVWYSPLAKGAYKVSRVTPKIIHLPESAGPRIYLAGKISKNCWRQKLVPNIRGASWSDAPLNCDKWRYTGPFFVSCDHSCGHAISWHGASPNGCGAGEGITRRQVFDANIQAINRSDALIAYLTSYDCIGSIYEITFAQERGIPTFLLFAPNVDAVEFWVPSIRSKRVRGLSQVVFEADLPGALDAIVRSLRRQRT
jgi:hypothetical protein